MAWEATPLEAWIAHIQPHYSEQGWIEDSKKISDDLALSKRELLTLIVFAHLYSKDDDPWVVGYDEEDGEPNDGYIRSGGRKVRFEHKVIPQQDRREALDAILGTYAKYAAKGASYGSGRKLIIHANKSATGGGAVKISDLREEIGESCPFDRVFHLSAVKADANELVIHVIQQYPWPPVTPAERAKGFGSVRFQLSSGAGEAELCAIDK